MMTTILGQLVSVSFGRTLTRELTEAAGTKANHPRTVEPMYLFPIAKQLLNADLSKVRTSESRRNALVLLQHWSLTECLNGRNRLSTRGCERSEYVAMHGFHDDDGFPATDYGLKLHPAVDVKKVKPWRAYAAMALWRAFANSR
jgi:DNA-3-methyladenine glycosylase II